MVYIAYSADYAAKYGCQEEDQQKVVEGDQMSSTAGSNPPTGQAEVPLHAYPLGIAKPPPLLRPGGSPLVGDKEIIPGLASHGNLERQCGSNRRLENDGKMQGGTEEMRT
jgi:hypothetical protein